jgi:hypothetical protein
VAGVEATQIGATSGRAGAMRSVIAERCAVAVTAPQLGCRIRSIATVV